MHAPPGGDHQVTPDVVRVIREPITNIIQTEFVMKHTARGELPQNGFRKGEPIANRQCDVDIEPHVVAEVPAQGVDLDQRRPPLERLWHLESQLDAVRDEHQRASLAVVVRRHLVVEPEHLRAPPEQRRTVRHVHHRPDDVEVEPPAQFQP
nr:hypothetical protein [Kribbella sp. VKM Ac-2571]